MKQQQCQILFIQETHFVKENINKINQIVMQIVIIASETLTQGAFQF